MLGVVLLCLLVISATSQRCDILLTSNPGICCPFYCDDLTPDYSEFCAMHCMHERPAYLDILDKLLSDVAD
jgi:hypothetical protein